METNRVSQLDETGSGYIFQQHASAKKSYPPIQKEKGLVCQASTYRNKTIEKLNVHIRISLYGENQSSSK
jgi:hypothetical protein